MGDKLRNKLSHWSYKEQEIYSQETLQKLGPAYLIKDIPKDQLANRVRYLDKILGIEDNSPMEKALLKIEEEKGKIATFIEMEKIAVERYF